jgi:hypothetical protein
MRELPRSSNRNQTAHTCDDLIAYGKRWPAACCACEGIVQLRQETERLALVGHQNIATAPPSSSNLRASLSP